MSVVSARLDAIEGRIAEDDDRVVEEWRERWPEKAALVAALRSVLDLAEEWRYKGEFGWGPWQIGEGPDQEGYVLDDAAEKLRQVVSIALEGT